MPYWDIVTRSFTIAWKHKYLWLIALFSGEAGTSINFNYSQSSRSQPGDVQGQLASWVNDHAGLIVAIAVVWLVLVIALFVLAAVCEGATVRASAEHDAGRPFGLRQAWTMGVHTMWVMVGFRLLLFVLYLPLLLATAAWVAGLILALVNNNVTALVAVLVSGPILLVVWLVYATYLFFLDRLGTRAVVLEERRAVAALQRAHRLLFKRFGRTLLVWLLSIAVAFVLAVILFCFGALITLPFLVAGAVAASGGQGVAWPLLVVAVIIFLPIYLVVAGFLGAQSSTYWTLAFRRLDTDYAPAYAYPAIPPATPPAPSVPQT